MRNTAISRTLPQSEFGKIKRDLRMNWSVYCMMIPVLAFYILFCYRPIYGAVIAFKKFTPGLGIWGSPWVGLDNFIQFFESRYFGRVVRNTLTISLSSIIIGFPAPILFALLLNEIRSRKFAKAVQTVTYMPHFISLVVMCGIVKDFVADTGIVTQFFRLFGYSGGQMLNEPNLFVPIYITTELWQELGWGSIIYIAAILGVDKSLYEAAEIDGAGRMKQVIHITLPGILPVIVTMFILRLGGIMNVGFEKIILLYNPATYETADVISSYVYRAGLQDFQYGYSTAVGLFNSMINFIFVFVANTISNKINETSLW